jgi:hypothetical protein
MQGFNGKCLFKQVGSNYWKKRINLNQLKREYIHIMKKKKKIGTKPTTKWH